jgi:uncharacterized protein
MRARRQLESVVQADARKYPIVTIVGPRQSGKTTLARACFPAKPYANLEEPDTRRFAKEDPRAFLARFERGAVLDEIQRAPEIASYLQADVDARGELGRWVLTGSHQPELRQSVSQSLAGRTAVLTLLPFSLGELATFGRRFALDELVVSGFYPRLHDAQIEPHAFHADYVATYLERDVRLLINLRDVDAFQRFIGLCAGRAATLLNHSALAADTGVHQTTAADWATTLGASFVTTKLSPWFANIGKRLVKMPKLYWYDVGLASHLLGFTLPGHVQHHPLRGALFENLVVAEVLKLLAHTRSPCRAHFYRDSQGYEVDLVLDVGGRSLAIEIKAGRTVASDWFTTLERFRKIPQARVDRSLVVYGGDEEQVRSNVVVTPWWRLPVHVLGWLGQMNALPHPADGRLEEQLAAAFGVS